MRCCGTTEGTVAAGVPDRQCHPFSGTVRRNEPRRQAAVPLRPRRSRCGLSPEKPPLHRNARSRLPHHGRNAGAARRLPCGAVHPFHGPRPLLRRRHAGHDLCLLARSRPHRPQRPRPRLRATDAGGQRHAHGERRDDAGRGGRYFRLRPDAIDAFPDAALPQPHAGPAAPPALQQGGGERCAARPSPQALDQHGTADRQPSARPVRGPSGNHPRGCPDRRRRHGEPRHRSHRRR